MSVYVSKLLEKRKLAVTKAEWGRLQPLCLMRTFSKSKRWKWGRKSNLAFLFQGFSTETHVCWSVCARVCVSVRVQGSTSLPLTSPARWNLSHMGHYMGSLIFEGNTPLKALSGTAARGSHSPFVTPTENNTLGVVPSSMVQKNYHKKRNSCIILGIPAVWLSTFWIFISGLIVMWCTNGW